MLMLNLYVLLGPGSDRKTYLHLNTLLNKMFSRLNILNSLHYYIQTQQLFRGKMTAITWHPFTAFHFISVFSTEENTQENMKT